MEADRLHVGSDPSQPADHLLDLVFDAVFTFRLSDGRISYWNRGAERAYGWSPEEAIGRLPDELLDSVLPRPRPEILRSVLQRGHWEGEINQRHRDGHRMVVDGRWAVEHDLSGRAVGVLEVNRDITDQWNSSRQLEALFNAIRRDAIVMLDGEGLVRAWNPGAETVFGWTAAEMLGHRPPRGLRLQPGEHEGWLPRKGGRLWGRATASAVVDAAGAVHGIALVVADLTAQRRDEERQAAHERTRSEFMNLAAHELRSPITVIAGYLSMLAEGTVGSPDSETRRVLETLRAKVGQLSDMVEEIVEWTRLEEGKIELHLRTCDLNELVTHAVDGLTGFAGPRRRLDVELEPNPALVVADRRRLLLVLGSLLSVMVSYVDGDHDLHCRVRRVSGQLAVEIQAQCERLTAGEMARLFARSAPARPGLYLARWLAQLQGGDVLVDADPELGATFTLWLPPAPGAPVPPA